MLENDYALESENAFEWSRDAWGFRTLEGMVEHERQLLYQDAGRSLAMSKPMPISLDQAKVGVFLCVIHINGNPQMMQHLKQMGVGLGTSLRVLSRSLHGAVVIQIGEDRLGLGANTARKVIVNSQ